MLELHSVCFHCQECNADKHGCMGRVPFVYCFLVILYAMWLLIKYYQVGFAASLVCALHLHLHQHLHCSSCCSCLAAEPRLACAGPLCMARATM